VWVSLGGLKIVVIRLSGNGFQEVELDEYRSV
jgi:hypothetical protein